MFLNMLAPVHTFTPRWKQILGPGKSSRRAVRDEGNPAAPPCHRANRDECRESKTCKWELSREK